jgi:hypothetical protein
MTNEMDNFPYWSEEYTMNFLGYSETSMRALRKSKAVTRYEIGHRYFYDKQEIIKLIESSKVVKQEQDKLDKYIQSMNNTISLKDVSISEKNFILDKTYFILNRILNSLQEMDSDNLILKYKDWYLLMMCIESKGDFNGIAEKYNLTRERIRQIFEKSIRVLCVRTSSMKKSYLESCLEIETMKAEVHSLKIQNYELKAQLFELNKDSQLLSENTDSILYKSVFDLDASVRLMNVLRVNDCKTLGDVVRHERRDFLRFRNFGSKSLSELIDILEKYDLKLKR